MSPSTHEAKEMLLLLINGLSDWSKNYAEIPEDLYKGWMQFVSLAVPLENNLPVDLHQLISVLHRPSEEWGIPDLNNIYPEDAPLLKEHIGITVEADEFLNVYVSPQEAEQKYMFNILQYCRQEDKQLQKEYVDIRSFLSNPQNAVLSYTELFRFTSSLSDRELFDKVFDCYEEKTESMGNYRVCPHCGWTMELKQNQWCCNKEDVCHLLADKSVIQKFKFGENRVMRLRPGIQRYVLLPGISEMRLANKLLRKGYDVELYPKIDKYDLAVSREGKTCYLDMKDFRNPSALANFFNNQSEFELQKYQGDCFIVIPEYRNRRYPLYPTRSSNLLNEYAKPCIRIISEKEVEAKLEEVFF